MNKSKKITWFFSICTVIVYVYMNGASSASIEVGKKTPSYSSITFLEDVPALKEAFSTARAHVKRDSWLARKGPFWCAQAANDLADDLIVATNDTSSPLNGWGVQTIENACHRANILTSPGSAPKRYYYIENNLDLVLFEFEEFDDNGTTKWRPQDDDKAFKKHLRKTCHLRTPSMSNVYIWKGLGQSNSGSLSTQQVNSQIASNELDCPISSAESTSIDIETIASFDPNDKVGSTGAGISHYISGDEPLRYSIFFENLETATAAAQEVLITDQLDADVMDFSTFSLGPIAFGDHTITPPSGVKDFTTDVDLRPENNLLVRIKAGLNQTTGLIAWRFSSIDPVTGLLPEDPVAGFLPPNITPPEGDGSVLFTINPKEGLLTGTAIRNKADIIFDTNEPIITPEWLNTIDVDKPVSNVLPLDDTQSDPEFMVYWTGSDIGSGVKDYTVYVSEDGGPFIEWLINTTETSSTYTGENGKSYAFYSVARDFINHVEDIPDASDATTLLISNLPPVANAGGPYAVDEGSNVVVSAAASTDPEGELLSYEWDFDYDGMTFTVDTSGITPTFSADALDGPATRNIAVRVADPQGARTIAQSSVAIANVGPVIDDITGPVDPVQANIAVNVSASFTDSGKSDTHTATVDWGEGNSTNSDATTVNGAGSIAESHSYTASGVYTVTVTITDDDGDSDTQLYQYVVVYDPDSGFVTGGGQIVSPAGAYVVDPTLTGKAVFGFNAKYKKGQSTPSGNSQFQFKTANLHFHSDSYEWLVVAGPQAKFKGVGTINGTGSYGFMISAVDGEVNGGGGVDKFRIKIWDVVTDAVVYDSEMGLADDDAPSTAITKGSIVIHNK